MFNLLFATLTQTTLFLPLALGISISYTVLNATDMTVDGSFVLGAAIFARLVTQGISPVLAGLMAILAGASAGILVSLIQRGGKIEPLLAGILATFILSSMSLIIMGRPNISLLSANTLFSTAFAQSENYGWALVTICSASFSIIAILILTTHFGLTLRALGNNPQLLKRLGKNIETFRLLGFAFTNMLAATSGCLTAQLSGYADIGMGVGVTLTGIGAIILGQQLIRLIVKKPYLRVMAEFIACLIGVFCYFLTMNGLLRLDVNPIYLKMILGIVLIFFLRSATMTYKLQGARS